VVKKKVWRKEVRPDFIQFEFVLTVEVGIFDYFNGFPGMVSVGVGVC
jgi:hypothetical protein